MFDLLKKTSRFNEDTGWFLYQEIILKITTRRRLQGKISPFMTEADTI